jgi:hypothetical protein
MTWSIRWKVAFGTLVAVACGLLIAGVMTVQSLEQQYLTQFGDALEAKTKLVEYGFQPLFHSSSPTPTSSSLQEMARDLGNRASARVTLIAADGTVFADSAVRDADLSAVENHKSRPEIQQALSTGHGRVGSLHEFGHGLYEDGIPDRFARSLLGSPVSLGVHESQSRLWENLVGRSRPFCAWALPRLAAHLPGALDGTSVDELYRGVNTVHRSLIRVEADETTYNLHVALRFELEVALLEGTLAVDDLPHAWNDGMHRLLGLDVPDDAQGVLQDVHWGAGLIGYFPTYTLGNLMAAQLWETLRAELGGLDAQIEGGDFGPLRTWLRERIHAHGRKLPPAELLDRVTGQELAVAPFMRYLRGKLADAGVLTSAPR